MASVLQFMQLIVIILICHSHYVSSVLKFRFLSQQPEQIHLSATGDASEMMVTWSTFNTTNTSTVEYGLDGRMDVVAMGTSTKFVDGGSEKHTQFIHRVKMTGLQSGQVYSYHCGSVDGWSEIFTFRALRQGSDWSPNFAVYGDLGNENAQSLGRLQEETQKGMYDAILHVGDFAYDFHNHNGRVGDAFMRQIEAVAGYLPYMTCPGNHEEKYNFTNYKNRFTMPQYNKTQNLWYSWNVGPVHIVSFSTEVNFYQKYGTFLITEQQKWLEADLQEANKPETRARQPWIITMGHRPAYCSDKYYNVTDCTRVDSITRRAFEDLFYKYGVDLEFWAHQHSYERLWPVYNETVYNGSRSEPYTNPKAPVHIITGSAGCVERLADFGPPRIWDAFRSEDYGYTRLKVWNATHLHVEQVSDDQGGKVIDAFTLIKDTHGPEAWR